jgi:hypothetical protein
MDQEIRIPPSPACSRQAKFQISSGIPNRQGRVLNRQKEDRKIFAELIRFLDTKKSSIEPTGQVTIQIGKFFLETPYVIGTLETGIERFVVNLRELDCVTFVENVVALVGHIKSREKSFDAFRRYLRRIRYRQGRLQGYASRLHYFSDWIYDNQRKGIVRDVTAEIGGTSLKKVLNFMTTHPDLYLPLKNAASLRRMKSIERAISRRPLFFIPQKDLRHVEDRICDGDLIAITTNRVGLDVQHVGFAARVKNRIHFLHASQIEGKVVLSKETLHRYLIQDSSRSGIMVARVL